MLLKAVCRIYSTCGNEQDWYSADVVNLMRLKLASCSYQVVMPTTKKLKLYSAIEKMKEIWLGWVRKIQKNKHETKLGNQPSAFDNELLQTMMQKLCPHSYEVSDLST